MVSPRPAIVRGRRFQIDVGETQQGERGAGHGCHGGDLAKKELLLGVSLDTLESLGVLEQELAELVGRRRGVIPDGRYVGG